MIMHLNWYDLCIYPCIVQGRNCENDLNMCRSSPCLNGGTCSNSPDSFECMCAPGFNGSTCELTINVTDTKPTLQGEISDCIIRYTS